MIKIEKTLCISTIAVVLSAVLSAGIASADAMRANVAFNNGIGEQTAEQPTDGVTIAYQITLDGGELNDCTVDIVESLYPRDAGAWGIFDIAGDLNCANGKFSYTTSGAWDGNGFHASGDIVAGSGSGDFDGIAGRMVQLGGGAAEADGGSLDIHYELVVDRTS